MEAPFIVKPGDYWYLFVCFDRCCRAVKSTYNVAIGRSRDITGPYEDKTGKPMSEGGGSLVMEATTPNWRGPGHQAVLRQPDGGYLFFHAGHGTSGQPHLHIWELVWEDNWPRAGKLP